MIRLIDSSRGLIWLRLDHHSDKISARLTRSEPWEHLPPTLGEVLRLMWFESTIPSASWIVRKVGRITVRTNARVIEEWRGSAWVEPSPLVLAAFQSRAR